MTTGLSEQAQLYIDYQAWREQTLLNPDVSFDAYTAHLAAQSALEALNQKEITT